MIGALRKLSIPNNAVLDENGIVLLDELYDVITLDDDRLIGVFLSKSKANGLKGKIVRDAKLYGVLRVISTKQDVYEEYSGPYEITPKVSIEQTLQTADKLAKENITVLEIPYFEVSNNSGGTTVTIG